MKQHKIYAEVLEDTALEQFMSAMALDYVEKGALMPDAHTGYGLPIGGVVATKGVIVPAWVGYDIGCGMCAMKTSFSVEDVRENADKIYDTIYETIPVGFHVHPQEKVPHTHLDVSFLSDIGAEAFEKRKGFQHHGTLGGGNHFIEIGYGQDETVWIVVHSGSRGVGHGTAQSYMRLASGDGKVREGHYPIDCDSELGKKYINDMNWLLKFALENRLSLVEQTEKAIATHIKGGLTSDLINRNHNHAELNDGLWIHRKGATHADKGMMGVIPGNMRDGSFIVRGLGNDDSLCSSSHGAGRVLGRKKAKETLNLDDFKETMSGVKASVDLERLDESPFAYKDIEDVMRLQSELVEVVDRVYPIINIKG